MSKDSDAPGQTPSFEYVLAEYLQAVEAGKKPDRGALLRRFPHLATELQAYFENLACFENVAGPPTLPVAARTSGGAPLLRSFGDYEIVEELGRGGMGVVYKAWQKSLKRAVALKVLLAGPLASANDLQRFGQEAEAAAELHHPNIVPIHEVGTVQIEGAGTYPYFTMDLVAGGNLTERIRSRIQVDAAGQVFSWGEEQRKVAGLLAAVARAVHFAHQHRILHRDLKPGNVLLDERGEPHLTDFGLAKRLDRGAGLTHPDGVVGTPGYLAPELASHAQGVTTAVDVYGLGAILYELLTGRPPFKGETPLDAVLQMLDHDPERPRNLDRRIDRDLETICLKCLEREPQQRYGSAEAVAENLERWLAGKPIWGRPVRWPERMVKWGRRHPAAAALVVVSMAAAASLAVGGTWFTVKVQAERDIALRERAETERQRVAALQAQTEAERQQRLAEGHAAEAKHQEQQAREHQRRAELSYRLAREGLEKAVKKVAEDERLRSGPLEDLRRVVLEAELAFYQDFVKLRGDEAGFRAEQGQAYEHIGRLYHQFGRVAEAETAYRQAREAFTRLAAEFPREPQYRQTLASNYRSWARLLAVTNRHTEAEELFREALALYTQLTKEYPAEAAHREDRAITLDALATLYQTRLQRLREAEEAYREALALRRALVRERPRDALYRFNLAQGLHNLGVLYATTNRENLAEQAHGEARPLFLELTREFPDVASYRADLARNHNMLGHLYERTGRVGEAEKEYDQARALWQELADKHPARPAYRADLSYAYGDLASLYAKTGRPAKAEQAHRQVQTLRQDLADKHAALPDYRLGLANSRHNLGLFYRKSGRSKEAEQAYLDALNAKKALVRDHPHVARYRADLATTHDNLGGLYHDTDRQREAEQEYREALTLREALVRDYPEAPEYKAALAESQRSLGRLYWELNRPREAEQACRQALDLQKALVGKYPANLKYQADLARSYNLLGIVQDAGGRREAESAYREAVAIQEALSRKHPADAEYALDLGGMRCNLGHVLRDSGRLEDALASYAQALAALRTVLNKQADNATAREYLRNTHEGRAKALLRLNRLEEAEQARQDAAAAQGPRTPDNPSDPRSRHKLAIHYNDLGIQFYGAQQYPEAEQAYREALALYQALIREHPSDDGYAINLGGTQCNMGHLLRDSDRLEASLGWYGQAIATLEPIRARQPQLQAIRLFLRLTYSGRAEALTRLGRHADALKNWNQALGLADGPSAVLRCQRALTLARLKEHVPATAEATALAEAKNATARTLYDAARVYSLSAGAAGGDPAAEKYATRAVELLRQALGKGYKLDGRLAENPDLQILRDREDFQELLSQVQPKPKANPR